MGTGLSSDVYALALSATGAVLAGGNFVGVGGAGMNTCGVAQWTGTAWRTLGNGLNFLGNNTGQIRALVTAPNGDVVAGFAGPSSGYVVRWNGTQWQGLNGSTLTTSLNGGVNAIARSTNGELVVGGNFTDAGGNASADYIARWNGTAWQALGTGTDDRVFGVAFAPNGDVVAGGLFSAVGDGSKSMAGFGIYIDSQAPTLAFSTTASNPTSSSPIPVTVVFSENVTGFVAADVAVTNGTVGGFGGSGAAYSFSIIPTASGPVTATVAANAAQDAAGNGNVAAALFSITYAGPTATASATHVVPLYLYPNPANGSVTVSAANAKEVTVFNSLSQMVRRQALIAGKAEVNTADLAAGVYYVQAGSNARRKLLIFH